MTSLWTVQDMAAAMRADRSGALPDGVTGISIDSRTIGPGEAFFAITGDNRDGHAFAPAALQAKAGLAVIVADRRAEFSDDAPLLLVPNVLAALRALAAKGDVGDWLTTACPSSPSAKSVANSPPTALPSTVR